MNASELRIGNFVNTQIGERVIVGISKTAITHIKGYNIETLEMDKTSDVLPIPLTEELLLRFGFTNIDKSNIYVKSMHEIGAVKLKSLAVYIDENNYTVAIVDYYTGVEKTDLLHLDYKYVHQLQNLYFALVGEELHAKS